eukprot:238047-Pleurochrysis_carterae.AAC.1
MRRPRQTRSRDSAHNCYHCRRRRRRRRRRSMTGSSGQNGGWRACFSGKSAGSSAFAGALISGGAYVSTLGEASCPVCAVAASRGVPSTKTAEGRAAAAGEDACACSVDGEDGCSVDCARSFDGKKRAERGERGEYPPNGSGEPSLLRE